MRNLFARLLCAAVLLCVGVLSAHAEPQPKPLHSLNTFPYTGTVEEACSDTLHMSLSAHNAFSSKAECVAAMRASDDESVCPKRPVLQDGVRVWMLFSVPRGNRVEHVLDFYEIAFGDHIPANHPMRMANSCLEAVTPTRAAKPLACGNYSVLPPQEEPKYTWVQQCSTRAYSSPRQVDTYSSVPGIALGRGCFGGQTFYGGVTSYLDGAETTNSGVFEDCQWSQIERK